MAPTKQELAAENERLRKDNAAQRTLLAAVRDAATVPLPADDADMREHFRTCANRVDAISVYANPDMTVGDGPRTPTMLHNAAEDLRREAARPLRYTPKGADEGIEAADAQAAGQ